MKVETERTVGVLTSWGYGSGNSCLKAIVLTGQSGVRIELWYQGGAQRGHFSAEELKPWLERVLDWVNNELAG